METSEEDLKGWALDQGPLPHSHDSVIWRFFIIVSPFEVSVGTVRRTFSGAETCDVQTFRGSDESFKSQPRDERPDPARWHQTLLCDWPEG